MSNNGGPPITDDAPRLRFVRVHINDWVASTRGMSLDEEGFFWRFTCLFYDRMGDLIDDDSVVSRAMNLDIRRYRHMKNAMIQAGKISIVGGRLTNARAEREIASYVAEFKRRSDAAFDRENRKRIAGATHEDRGDFGATSVPMSDRSRGDIGSKSAEDRLETDTDLFKKDNKNNRCEATTLPQGDHSPRVRARPKPKPKPEKEEEDNPPTPQGGLSPIDQAFENFWSAFPPGRKRGKGDAREAFRKIVTGQHRKGLRAKAETIIQATVAYAATGPDPEYTPLPSTWLNEGRWEDDVEQADPAPVKLDNGKQVAWGWWRGKEDQLRKLPIERWQAAFASAKPNGIWPWWVLTAPPGHAECLVPTELQGPLIEVYRGKINHV